MGGKIGRSLALAIGVALFLGGCQSSPAGEVPAYLQVAVVDKVIDGDTIQVVLADGSSAKVRLIGIDTPEIRHPSKGKEPFGPEASDFTKENLLGRQVYLEKDVSETDRFDRLLRYVWTDIPSSREDEAEIRAKLFNARLVADGYALAYTYPPDVARSSLLLQLQREARENQRGLWGLADYQQDATTSASRTKTVTHPNPGQEIVETEYMGNANSKKFHRPDCASVGTIKDSNLVVFSRREDAVEAGFVPCKACNP